jgi:gas vesicle protein
MTDRSADTSMQGNGESAMDAVHSGARRTVGMAQENPLGLAAAAAAVGFVAGSLLPSTRVEEERIGPVASQARQLASEAVEHGKQVAQDSAQAAAETASESGQQHAQALKRSAEESASRATPASGSQSTVG